MVVGFLGLWGAGMVAQVQRYRRVSSQLERLQHAEAAGPLRRDRPEAARPAQGGPSRHGLARCPGPYSQEPEGDIERATDAKTYDLPTAGRLSLPGRPIPPHDQLVADVACARMPVVRQDSKEEGHGEHPSTRPGSDGCGRCGHIGRRVQRQRRERIPRYLAGHL
jgi:hypothetical protein